MKHDPYALARSPSWSIAHQHALDVLTMAETGGMPDTYWATDGRITRARATLKLTVAGARSLARRQVEKIEEA